MTWLGTRRRPVQDPLDEHHAALYPDPGLDAEAAHRRALVLSEVVAEGPVGLYRVLRRAASGDEDAAAVPVSALVRAIPGVTLLDSHDFLVRSHIPAAALAGELTPGQRVALVYVVDGTHVAPDLA
jgi:hypothetical protein